MGHAASVVGSSDAAPDCVGPVAFGQTATRNGNPPHGRETMDIRMIYVTWKFTEATRKLLTDQELRRLLSSRGIRLGDRYSRDAMVDQFDALISSLRVSLAGWRLLRLERGDAGILQLPCDIDPASSIERTSLRSAWTDNSATAVRDWR